MSVVPTAVWQDVLNLLHRKNYFIAMSSTNLLMKKPDVEAVMFA